MKSNEKLLVLFQHLLTGGYIRTRSFILRVEDGVFESVETKYIDGEIIETYVSIEDDIVLVDLIAEMLSVGDYDVEMLKQKRLEKGGVYCGKI